MWGHNVATTRVYNPDDAGGGMEEISVSAVHEEERGEVHSR
jgi:hypothetical protein